MRVAILGNGFDLHHTLDTSFNHFRDYLLAYSKGEVKSDEVEKVLKSDKIKDINKFIEKIDEVVKEQDKDVDFNIISWADFEAKFNNFVTRHTKSKDFLSNI